jgi:uncharacterized protein
MRISTKDGSLNRQYRSNLIRAKIPCEKIMQNSLVHFELPVNDPEKMSRFYTEAFGWSFESHPMGEGQTYWMITTGPRGKSLPGGMYKKQGADELARFYVGDEDLEGAIKRVEKAGGSLVQRFEVPGMVTGALMYDPERNVVGVIKSSSSRATRTTGRSSSRNSTKKMKTTRNRKR